MTNNPVESPHSEDLHASDFDLFDDLGLDRDDPEVRRAVEDAETHARLIETLVGVRKDCQLRQKDVAARMGTTQSRVSELERIGGDPRLTTLLRYARAVDCRLKIVVTPSVETHWRRVGVRVQAASATATPTYTWSTTPVEHPVGA